MIGIFLVSVSLYHWGFYKVMVWMQVVFYLMALTGALARYQKYGILNVISKVCYIPYVFCLLNFSALIGFLRFLSSRQDFRWEKAKAD
jgi:hypothetical protein